MVWDLRQHVNDSEKCLAFLRLSCLRFLLFEVLGAGIIHVVRCHSVSIYFTLFAL